MPFELAWYRPELHGGGVEGIRAWSVPARAWLAEDPARRLPGDRNLLDVYRETVRMLRAELGGQPAGGIGP